ncbi:MAG: hypothetical protein MJY78_05400 [Fibrobacter sp.]|nr:hypothetical protein [Fibrobacter sp.]
MKKFIAPIVLFVLALGVVLYLTLDFSGKSSSFDVDSYLQLRSKIDSLQIALFEVQGTPDAQLAIRGELEASWETLNALRDIPAPQKSETAIAGLSKGTWAWIAGGAAAVFFCVILLLLALKQREIALTQKMEVVKDEESRFKEPKNGFDSDSTLAPHPRKHSIIDEAMEFAEKDKATPTTGEAPKVAFEDENGVPENKILTTDLDRRPQLRPTARERITSAIQSLSDVLRTPKGLTRDRTMKLRAQSHNATGDPTLGASHPLETSRFDREFTEKTKILQMSRRGFPASAIASQLKVPQEKVEEIIQNALDSGN